MPGFLSPVDIRAVHARIVTSSEHLDAMVKDLLTSLGFTDIPAYWPSEVERVLTDLAGSARLAAVQQICATAQSFRDRKLEKEASERLADIVLKGMEFNTTLQVLTGLTSTDLESFDPECRNIIRSHLPELNEKSAAFSEDVTPLKAMQAEMTPSYTILATQRLDLEAALNAWLHIEIPSGLVLTGKIAILQLLMLADERRAIVDRAGTLMSDLTSSYASSTPEDQDRACDDLRGLARSLAVQVAGQRLHLTTIANTVRTLRNEFPALHVRGFEVAVRDLLAVRYKHSIFEGRLAAISERSIQLRLMLGCMMNILRLDVDLASYKRSSASQCL